MSQRMGNNEELRRDLVNALARERALRKKIGELQERHYEYARRTTVYRSGQMSLVISKILRLERRDRASLDGVTVEEYGPDCTPLDGREREQLGHLYEAQVAISSAMRAHRTAIEWEERKQLEEVT